MNVEQVLVLLTTAGMIAGFLLALFSWRRVLGLAPLYMAIGALQFPQALSALTLKLDIGSGFLVTPGAVAWFPASMFAVLLVYMHEDAIEARKFIYGLIGAVGLLIIVTLSGVLHLSIGGAINMLDMPVSLLQRAPRVLTVSVLVLWIDSVFLILLYEWLFRHGMRSLLMRVYLSLAAVLIFDTALFVAGTQWGAPDLLVIFARHAAAKVAVAFVYAALMTVYLKTRPAQQDGTAQGQISDVFGILTYRQRFEALAAEHQRDALTGLYNRAKFDQALVAEIVRARRDNSTVALLLIDADHFKRINDEFGHPEGDRVLRVLAETIRDSVRGVDLPCRYGGEEFAVLLAGSNAETAEAAARRIQSLLRHRTGSALDLARVPGRPLTVTVGVALFPEDATDPHALLAVADRRLYAGKRGGRDRVIGPASEPSEALAAR
jgi:diguanylate cyclase (GGDEF)-like protein